MNTPSTTTCSSPAACRSSHVTGYDSKMSLLHNRDIGYDGFANHTRKIQLQRAITYSGIEAACDRSSACACRTEDIKARNRIHTIGGNIEDARTCACRCTWLQEAKRYPIRAIRHGNLNELPSRHISHTRPVSGMLVEPRPLITVLPLSPAAPVKPAEGG